MAEAFNYKSKARELHALRIALEKERYGRSRIHVQDQCDLLHTAAEAAARIARFFAEAFRSDGV